MYPEGLYYHETAHHWVRVEGATATIGITYYAQDQLGDIVYLELPQTDEEIAAGQPYGSIESVKAVADLNAPVSGRVVEVNTALEDAPDTINRECYGGGWIAKVELTNSNELSGLLGTQAYQQIVASLGGKTN